MVKQQRLTRVVQDIVIAFILMLFIFDYSTQDYTNFSDSPPTISDKLWYVSEAVLFALFAIAFAVLNNALLMVAGWSFLKEYLKAWKILARFLLLRILWEIIWVITGVSVNSKIAQAVLFSIVLIIVFCITYLPYLKPTSNKKK